MDIEVYKSIPNKNLYILHKLYPNANIIKSEVKYMNLLKVVDLTLHIMIYME